jgi:ubiquinone/menaquinone biosynthesis C-methylase UbiE
LLSCALEDEVTKIERPGVRAGYDQWSESYDRTPNPLVALDRRHTVDLLGPRPGEHILDAGCGTGGNLRRLVHVGSRAVGVDLSRGMLRVARRALGDVWLAQADLAGELPVRAGGFDAVLCALVGEHLPQPVSFFRQARRALHAGGRLIFSVFHPAMAAAGAEANFQHQGVEYRLGAHRHSVGDYLQALDDAGFGQMRAHEFRGDAALAAAVPAGARYLGKPLLLAVEALA